MTVRRPRVTVFTPSHRPRFLDDCYRSLVDQTWTDWEWVVALNGGARWRPPCDDVRVRLIVADELSGVGAVKQLACSVALGEYLVELDHDDLLAADALEDLLEQRVLGTGGHHPEQRRGRDLAHHERREQHRHRVLAEAL